MNLCYPNITGKTPAEQIGQLRSFLYHLVEELNLQEGSINPSVADGARSPHTREPLAAEGKGAAVQEASPVGQFNQIKSLIIKSADIIDAYHTEINRRLEGKYVAVSDYGTFTEQTTQKIMENDTEIERVFENIKKISVELEKIIGTKAYVRQGLLFEVGEETLEPELGQMLPAGAPVYGVEVGQTVTENDTEVFHKFARFTAYGVTLYDNNGILSAYITDNRLNIPNAVIDVSLTRGGFRESINADGGSVERWVGV